MMKPLYLLYHSGVSETGVLRLGPTYFEKFRELETSLRTFVTSLPPVTHKDVSFETPSVSHPSDVEDDMEGDEEQSRLRLVDVDTSGEDDFEGGGPRPPAHSSRTHTLVFAHSLAQASLVQIYAIMSENDTRARHMMLECAMRTTELIELVEPLEANYYQVLVVVSVLYRCSESFACILRL
jgi:hypothetical protein